MTGFGAFSGLGFPRYQAPLPLVLGHFLPWYTRKASDFPLPLPLAKTIGHPPVLANDRHWSDSRSAYRRTHLHLPEIGLYDSRDPQVIAWQLEQARAAGLDGFIINWYGQHSVENVITLAVIAEIEKWNHRHAEHPFCYFFSIDSQSQLSTEGKVAVPLEEDLRYLRAHLLRPGYLLRNGRPIFSCFPYEANAPDWISALDAVFAREGYDFLWCNRPQGVGETGCYAWVQPDEETVDQEKPYPWSDPDNVGALSVEMLYAEWNRPHFRHRYGMAGIWPGFNDGMVAWAWKPAAKHAEVRPRVIVRESTGGNTYERLWRSYLDYLAFWRGGKFTLPLPLVQIVTWNDYAEATTIEPTRDYGHRYIELTAQAVLEARRLWAGSGEESRRRSPLPATAYTNDSPAQPVPR